MVDKVHILFDSETVKKEMGSEQSDSRKQFLHKLLWSSNSRTYQAADTSISLDDLYDSFPNFIEAIDILSEQTALASLSKNAIFSIRPILLVGPPGVGKTRFIKEVSKRLNLEFSIVNCGGVTAGWILSGSSTSWHDGRPGMVHCALRDGDSGNPIIMLDEIDKLTNDTRFSAFGPLYQLLEKDSAKAFSDEAVGIPIDCSQVTWIATANNISEIPEAIVSRFTVIEVEAPSPGQMVSVINSIYADILEQNMDSWGSLFERETNEEMIKSLDGQMPREIVKMILTAIGRAAKAKGHMISNGEKIKIEASDFKDFKKPKRRIGF